MNNIFYKLFEEIENNTTFWKIVCVNGDIIPGYEKANSFKSFDEAQEIINYWYVIDLTGQHYLAGRF